MKKESLEEKRETKEKVNVIFIDDIELRLDSNMSKKIIGEEVRGDI